MLRTTQGVPALHLRFPHWTLCQHPLKWSDSPWTLFATGVFTGMNLCPPFMLAVGTAIGSDALLKSVMFFFIFFLATSIYLLPFLFSGLISRSAPIRSAAQIVCGCTGLWYVVMGLKKLLV